MKFLFFGARGWIASYFLPILKALDNAEVVEATVRADDTAAVERLLDEVRPDRVVCFVGRTHGGAFATIDYLEQPDKLRENLNDNLFAPLSLALACRKHGVHMTYLGTGCIFSSDDPAASNYNEDDLPDFFGSAYSTVKGFTDRLMHQLADTVLNVRIRMPITADRAPRNFLTKIVGYRKICSIPNSMTVLPTLLPVLANMIVKRYTGTINLCNPDVMSHNEILEMYRDIVDPTHTWENMTIDEQNTMLLSKRSNNHLDTTLIQRICPTLPTLREDMKRVLMSLKETDN